MLDLTFFTSRKKSVVGVISIILCILVFFLTPPYIEWYLIIPFAIFAIFLIIPHDTLQYNKVIGAILIIFSIFVIYTSINGVLNPYDVATNLYVNGYFSTTPTTSEISSCAMGYGIVLIYAIINILFGVLFFIPSTVDIY